jgi:RNA polymerase sigma-70 factor (ECF subfamily)
VTDTEHRKLAALARARMPSGLRAKLGADDVVQEVLRRVARAAARFDGRTPEERLSYLRHTFNAVLTDALRLHTCGRRQSANDLVLAVDPPADHTSPSGRAARNEQLDRLHAALAALPDDQRQAIELHHLRGFSLIETAEEMGRSWTSVAGLIRRGLATLRQRLAEREP